MYVYRTEKKSFGKFLGDSFTGGDNVANLPHTSIFIVFLYHVFIFNSIDTNKCKKVFTVMGRNESFT